MAKQSKYHVVVSPRATRMPIEQVQRLLGHQQIDTTLRYAMVNQENVKLSHRRLLG